MSIKLNDASTIIYNGNIVLYINYNGKTVYNNPITNNYYILPLPYQRYEGLSYEIPEYNSHTLVLPEYNGTDILDLHFNFDSHGYHDNIYYVDMLSNVIRCDDDCFGICIDHAGSAGNGCNRYGYHKTIKTTEDTSTLIYNKQLNEVWYRASATPVLEGSYASKIYHVPSDAAYSFDIILGKYGSFIATELDSWEEHGKEMAFNRYLYHSTYDEYLYIIGLTNDERKPLYTTPILCDYYYSVINEKLQWTYNNISENYKKCIFYTLDIIESITANNEVYKQTLTCKTSENTTNNIRYQILLYNVETDASKPRGYLPSISKESYKVKSPRIIIVLDPKNEKLIYWGAEKYNYNFQHSSILRRDYTDITLQTLTDIYPDFSGLSFAKLSTIKKMNNILFDITKDRPYIGSCLVYVAIPEMYYNKVIPHFFDGDETEITTTNPLISNTIYECTYIGQKYYLYTIYSKYMNTSLYSSGYVYNYTSIGNASGQLISKITVDLK